MSMSRFCRVGLLIIALATARSDLSAQEWVMCFDCSVCPYNENWTRWSEGEWVFLWPGLEEYEEMKLGSGNGSCVQEDATCEDLIPCYQPEIFGGGNGEEELQLLASALGVSKDGAAAYLERHPGKVVHVPERNAVQIRGCYNSLVAHLPLKRPPVAE